MDYYPSYRGLEWLAALVPVAFVAGFVYLIIYLALPKEKRAKIDWRRWGVGALICIVLPSFIGYTASAFFETLQNTPALITMVVLAMVFMITGLFIAHHTVISWGLMVGSIIAIIYSVGLNVDSVPPSVITILAGLGLILLIYFAYQRLREKEVI